MADVMDPDQVVAMVVYLASPQSSVSHEIYTAAAGRFARCFVGVNRGWHAGTGNVATPEDVADHLGEIRDVSKFEILSNVGEELALIADVVGIDIAED